MSLVSIHQSQLIKPSRFISYDDIESLRGLNLKSVSGKTVPLEVGTPIKKVTVTIEEEESISKTQKTLYLIGHRVAIPYNADGCFTFGPLQRLDFLASTMSEAPTVADKRGYVALDERSNLPFLIDS